MVSSVVSYVWSLLLIKHVFPIRVSNKVANHSEIKLSSDIYINDFVEIKGSQLSAFFPYTIVYCYLEFKHCYFKNLKLFSINIKQLFEPIVLRRKGDGFLLFLKAFS